MRYRLTRDAAEDLSRIYEAGVEHFGVEQAERYYRELVKCLALLAEHPRIARRRLEFRQVFRAHRWRSHVVAYREEAEGVVILRVFHSRQDWQDIF